MTDNFADQLPPFGPPPYPQPGNPNNQSPYPTIYPPPAQGLARAFLAERMAPIPVATRLPQPGKTEDSINGFIRIEAAGGTIMADGIMFNVGVLIHSYANNNDESMAELNCIRAVAMAGNAQGRNIIHPSLQRPWFITYSHISGLPVKINDPLVNMVRFRAMVMWRTQGMNDPFNEPYDATR